MRLKNCGDPTGAEPCIVELRPGAFINRCEIATWSGRWMAGACVADQLTGFIQVRDASFEGPVATTLYVDAGWRRQGIGTLLLAAAIDWAASQRANALRLTCERSDWPMRHLARKFGARLDLVLGQIVADVGIDRRSAQTVKIPMEVR